MRTEYHPWFARSLRWCRCRSIGCSYCPVIHRCYWCRLVASPSGGRVEMRQVGTSNIYESQDSSYTQLTDNGTSGAIVRTTDGTQFSFTPVTVNNEYRCTQIKDRNGNYIS